MDLMTVSDLDLYLFSEGRHEHLWDVLGAHPVDGGTHFAVWAPGAQAVFVDGEFTQWDLHGGIELSRQGPSGVWSGFAPDAGKWQRYKYRLLGADGQWQQHADPMATHTEVPPATASVIFASGYQWGDAEWLANRSTDHHARPDVGLRGAPGLVAAGTVLCGPGGPARHPRHATWASRTWSSCR